MFFITICRGGTTTGGSISGGWLISQQNEWVTIKTSRNANSMCLKILFPIFLNPKATWEGQHEIQQRMLAQEDLPTCDKRS